MKQVTKTGIARCIAEMQAVKAQLKEDYFNQDSYRKQQVIKDQWEAAIKIIAEMERMLFT